MKTFVDFIIDANKTKVLMLEFSMFCSSASAESLNQWFKDRGYDVPSDECNKMLAVREKLLQIKVSSTEVVLALY